jgi:beta-glucosidase
MPNAAFPRVCIATLIILLTAALGRAQPSAKTLAVFGDAVAVHPAPAGWQFQWNATGPLGRADSYAPLQYDDEAKAYAVLDDHGKWRRDRPSANQYVSVSAAAEGDTARYFIASYTLPGDTAGRLWLNHVNLRNRSFNAGVHLAVYVNHQLQHERLIARDRMAAVFQVDLGPRRRGDVIDVAVGPPAGARQGGGKLHFVLQDVPAGQQPPPPIAIVTPGVDDAVPQLGNDGQILPSYQEKVERHNTELVARQSKLVFLGDSITARWPDELLEAHFGNLKPVKLGGAGDWVQNLLWRVQNSDLDQVQPRLVVLLIGTNNLTHDFTPEEVAHMTGKVIAAIQQKSPQTRVLVQGILPRGRAITEPINDTVKQTNAQLARLADDQRVFFLDVGPALVEPDGSITAEVMPDKLHVAMAGYQRWLTQLKPVIERLTAAKP